MFNTELQKGMNQFPDGLGVRIPDSHSGGPGSIPGQGDFFVEFYKLVQIKYYQIVCLTFMALRNWLL